MSLAISCGLAGHVESLSCWCRGPPPGQGCHEWGNLPLARGGSGWFLGSVHLRVPDTDSGDFRSWRVQRESCGRTASERELLGTRSSRLPSGLVPAGPLLREGQGSCYPLTSHVPTALFWQLRTKDTCGNRDTYWGRGQVFQFPNRSAKDNSLSLSLNSSSVKQR